MAATLKLYINWFTRQLQLNAMSGSTFTPAPFVQGDILPVQVQLLEPDPDNGANAFVLPDISNMSLEAVMSATPVGNVADTPFMTQYAFTKDIVNSIFTAAFDFTAALTDTFLGAASSKAAFLSFVVREGVYKWTAWQGSVTLNATNDKNVAPGAPVLGQTYLTAEDAAQRFPGFKLLAGQTITFQSPDGTHQRITGVRDDATAQDDLL